MHSQINAAVATEIDVDRRHRAASARRFARPARQPRLRTLRRRAALRVAASHGD